MEAPQVKNLLEIINVKVFMQSNMAKRQQAVEHTSEEIPRDLWICDENKSDVRVFYPITVS